MSEVIQIYTMQYTCTYSTTVLLKYMEIQKFKTRLTTALFAAVNHNNYHNTAL